MPNQDRRDFPALLLLEVTGMLDAAVVVDAMFKSADITLIESLRVGGGRVAIWAGGDLSAVNTATDAAYLALADSREARSCIFTLPSDVVREFMSMTVAA
jgi:microcompartment protein CcmL/EutN